MNRIYYKKDKKIAVSDLIFYLIFLGPIILTVQGILKINLHYELMLIGILLLEICMKFKIKTYFYICFVVCLSIYSIIYAQFTDLFLYKGFLLLILILNYFSYKINIRMLKSFIERNLNYIYYSVVGIFSINIIYIFLPAGWDRLWGGRVFIGYMGYPHQTAYFICSLMIIFMIITLFSNNKRIKNYSIYFSFMSLILSCFTNVRTIVVAMLLVYTYFLIKVVNNKFIWVFILISMGILLFLLNCEYKFIKLNNIPIINKFLESSEKQNLLNSRDLIWQNLINIFNNSLLLDKIFGYGFGATQQMNYLYLNEFLWAHNDFIEVLLSLGIVGIIIYGYSLIKLFYSYKSYLLIIFLVLLAFFNGLFIYLRIVYSLPLFILFFIIVKQYKLKK